MYFGNWSGVRRREGTHLDVMLGKCTGITVSQPESQLIHNAYKTNEIAKSPPVSVKYPSTSHP